VNDEDNKIDNIICVDERCRRKDEIVVERSCGGRWECFVIVIIIISFSSNEFVLRGCCSGLRRG